MKQIRTYLFLFACLMSLSTFAQKADAIIDRNEILIGEQAVISLTYPITKANPEKVEFPQIGETLLEKIEVLRKSKVDTLPSTEGVSTIRLEQKIYITSFDTGYYAIAPFEFIVNGNAEATPAFLLAVKTVEIDTTGSIMADRDIYTVDVSFMDYVRTYWKYPAIGLGAALLVAIIVLLLVRYNEKKKRKPVVAPVEPERPAHEVALERLAKIGEEKLYKRGKIKEYHTAITDALRDYLERSYQITAHELTTSQIITALKYSGIPEIQMVKLRTILFRADMVKFAKETPDELENSSAVIDAVAFVQNTIPVDKLEEKQEGDA